MKQIIESFEEMFCLEDELRKNRGIIQVLQAQLSEGLHFQIFANSDNPEDAEV